MAKEVLINVKNLSVAFRSSGVTTTAVKGVSFRINRGETVALVGESGSGKSVSALSILKLLPYPAASHPTGEIFFEGRDLLHAKEGDLKRIRGDRISMIFQEPMTSLNPLHPIERQVGEILQLHRRMSASATRARVIELLTKVGIPEPEKRLGAYPHQLSGGQRQRVMIAMALANEPDLLIADEPTTALDVTIQAQILELLRDLQREMGMAMLLITHDLGIVRRMAERVYVMQKGEIVEEQPTEALFTDPKHPYTRHLLAAEPKGEPPRFDEAAPVIAETDDLKVWFPIKRGLLRKTVDHVKAVDGLSVKIRAGQTLGVVGESGSGKTTLGLAILRLISSQGPIVYMGRRIDGLSSKEMRPLRREMQVVFQDPYGSLSPRLSIFGIIEEGLLIQKPEWSEAQRRAQATKALEEVGLDASALDRYPHEFSGGQRQRIAIARAMVLKPRFVVLDELHAHKTRALYDVIRSAFGSRRSPLLWIITTAGYNTTGICYEQRSFVTKVLQGALEADHYFGVIFSLDEKDDPYDEARWVKANPMLGITPSWKTMRGDAKDAQASPSSEGNFLTKNLNRWLSGHSRWLNIAQWLKCADPTLDWKDFEGLDCWVGGDLADKDDITALVLAAFDAQDRLIFKPMFWLPEAVLESPNHAEGKGPAPYRTWVKQGHLHLTPGDWVDHNVVEAKAVEWIEGYGVRKATFDQFAAAQAMASRINENHGDGALAGILHKKASAVTDPAKELEARVKSGPSRLRHDGNPVMNWMASNVVVSRRRDETLLPIKESQMSPNKIDGIDALVNAIQPAITPTETDAGMGDFFNSLAGAA